MRFEFVFLDALDSSLGRVERESLPQQALMEMLIEGIANKEKICGDVDAPKDIEEWTGVSIEDGQVANTNHLTGTVDLASLPTAMKELLLEINAFTGSIGLERLPERMEEIYVFHNQLSGSLKLDSLPDTLTDFYA